MTARVAYLGPAGTFSHQAVRELATTRDLEAVPAPSIADALAAVVAGNVTYALVPIENALEGSVPATLDALIFDVDLVIVEELVTPVSLCLMAPAGVPVTALTEVWSYSHAIGQCRQYLARTTTAATQLAASTADAAQAVAQAGGPRAAIAPRVAAEIYGLTVLAEGIEDAPGNVTRFVLLGRQEIPAPTGHDRTTIICFQDADRPGSLYGILGRFAARDLNLTRLESRPTKRGLGEYCFVIELDGHIADDVVGDCLADLQAHHSRVKFLGSYPVTGEEAASRRDEVQAARVEADDWVATLRQRVTPNP
jgi:prephenate dehydratase